MCVGFYFLICVLNSFTLADSHYTRTELLLQHRSWWSWWCCPTNQHWCRSGGQQWEVWRTSSCWTCFHQLRVHRGVSGQMLSCFLAYSLNNECEKLRGTHWRCVRIQWCSRGCCQAASHRRKAEWPASRWRSGRCPRTEATGRCRY